MCRKFSPLNNAFDRLGIGRTTGYAQMAEGLLPRPIRIGKRAGALINNEIDAIMDARAAGASEEQIKKLVKQLTETRGVAL